LSARSSQFFQHAKFVVLSKETNNARDCKRVTGDYKRLREYRRFTEYKKLQRLREYKRSKEIKRIQEIK